MRCILAIRSGEVCCILAILMRFTVRARCILASLTRCNVVDRALDTAELVN